MNKIIILTKPKFLARPTSLSIEISELKIRQRYSRNRYLTVLDFNNEYSLLTIIKVKNDKSINKIFTNEINDPEIIETGIAENNTKK